MDVRAPLSGVRRAHGGILNSPRIITAISCVVLSVLWTAVASPALLSGSASAQRPLVGQEQADAQLSGILGSSGNLRAVIGTPAALSEIPVLQPLLSDMALGTPGVHLLEIPAPDGGQLVVMTLVAFSAQSGPRQDGYFVGHWPATTLAARDPRYAAPAGFIPVTPENASTQVSKHFQLRDFLTHDQQAVWPKVLVLRPVLVDKLELIRAALQRRGLPSVLHVMSGFRTPQYNAQGVGAKGGRARDSRQMYGDAADVFVDANADGVMDDLDGDGKSTVRDARVLFAVAESVEAQHPNLVGGLSAYSGNGAHGPFVHVDARGARARW